MNSIDKVLSIINLLSEKPHGVTEISKILGMGKSTVSRTLTNLKKEHWVMQDQDTQKFKLSFRMTQLSLSVISNLDIRRISLPYLNDLRHKTGETTTLNVLIDYDHVCVEQVQSMQMIHGVVPLGERLPLWAGATGKAILANMSSDSLKAILNGFNTTGIQTLPSGKKINMAELMTELESIRKRGFAIGSEEITIGAASISAPIFGRENQVTAAVTIIGPITRFKPKIINRFGTNLVEIAKKIGFELGFTREI